MANEERDERETAAGEVREATVGAAARGRRAGRVRRAAIAMIALTFAGMLVLGGVRLFAPQVLAGPRAVEACQRGAECLATDAAHCVDRAADGVVRGALSRVQIGECAQCLADLSCHQAERECGVCRRFVLLHEPPPLFPRGGAPTDMQLPIPSLFAPTDAPHGPPVSDDLFGDLDQPLDLPPMPEPGFAPEPGFVPPSSLPPPVTPQLAPPPAEPPAP